MKLAITKYNRDYYAGALMLALGLGAILEGRRYRIGTLSHMEPGFFPVALGVILAVLGVAIAATAKRSVPEGEEKRLPPEWRGWFCICLSIVAFIVIAKWGGLIAATFAIVFISALGDRDNTLKGAALLAAAMAVIAVAVFWWGLSVQIPLFRWG
jgi:hypothetical protein